MSTGVAQMLTKDPVMLNDSLVEVEGENLDYDTLTFWSDTFRHTDFLRYQDGDVQMMPTNTPETTTFELTLTVEDVPEYLDQFWKTGERFSIYVENEYFDLSVDNARIEGLDDGTITIVANVLWRAMSRVC